MSENEHIREDAWELALDEYGEETEIDARFNASDEDIRKVSAIANRILGEWGRPDLRWVRK